MRNNDTAKAAVPASGLADHQWGWQPIYRQLRDRVAAMIIAGVLKEGDALPSVRQVASQLGLNPITVLRGHRQLVDEALVEKRRGLGLFVRGGARAALVREERQRFLDEEWPRVVATMRRLGISIEELAGRSNERGGPGLASAGAPLHNRLPAHANGGDHAQDEERPAPQDPQQGL